VPRTLAYLPPLACACALLAGGAGWAQGPSQVVPADRSTIASCIAESASAPRACVGAIAVPCARQGGGDRREAEIACSRREAGAWRERLDAAMTMLAQRLGSGPRSRLAAVQRSWESFASQKCAFLGEVEPPARAPVMQAGCELTEVALRAIEVERMARAQAGPASPRPRIER
jgi:Lysozyme inhibitor LprI